MVVRSCGLPYDRAQLPPSEEMCKLIKFKGRRPGVITIGRDANDNHSV